MHLAIVKFANYYNMLTVFCCFRLIRKHFFIDNIPYDPIMLKRHTIKHFGTCL